MPAGLASATSASMQVTPGQTNHLWVASSPVITKKELQTRPRINCVYFQKPSTAIRTGAMGSRITTMTMNIVVKSSSTMGVTGTIVTARPSTTGSVRYVKVAQTSLIMVLHHI